MYIPSNMSFQSRADCHKFISEFSFGIIISSDLEATHLPFLLNSTHGEYGTLYSHFAKANTHWNNLNNQNVLVVFSGPHSYISPSWYQTIPAVPTWNYAAVHCYGRLTLLDKSATQVVLDETINKFEPELLSNKKIMPDEFRLQLAGGIVGFRISIEKIEGKLKLGQHRKIEDQIGVYEKLSQSENYDALELAAYMKRNLALKE